MQCLSNPGFAETRLRLIDRDHREMESHIAAIRSGLEAGWEQPRIGQLLERMTCFTHLHFALEDAMMNAIRYPSAAPHRSHHQWLVLELEALTVAFSRSQAELGGEPVRLLFEHLASHAVEDDGAFQRWLNRTRAV